MDKEKWIPGLITALITFFTTRFFVSKAAKKKLAAETHQIEVTSDKIVAEGDKLKVEAKVILGQADTITGLLYENIIKQIQNTAETTAEHVKVLSLEREASLLSEIKIKHEDCKKQIDLLLNEISFLREQLKIKK